MADMAERNLANKAEMHRVADEMSRVRKGRIVIIVRFRASLVAVSGTLLVLCDG